MWNCGWLWKFFLILSFVRADEGIYLAYSDFHQYLNSDSACSKELSQWFSKHLDSVCIACKYIYIYWSCLFHLHVTSSLSCLFHALLISVMLLDYCYKVPFRLVAQDGKAKCSWVSLDDISNVLVRGNHFMYSAIIFFCSFSFLVNNFNF